MNTQEKVLTVAGLGVLAWIIYANWSRKGNVQIESVDDPAVLPGLVVPFKPRTVGPPE